MLQINMADVMNVVGSLVPYLVVIGVLLVLAIIITFAVNKKTVKNVGSTSSFALNPGLSPWWASSWPSP